jgi:hypothetical protein
MNLIKNNNEKTNLEELVGKLKTEDSRYARISKAFQIVYWVFVPIYSFLAILSFIEDKNINLLIGGGCFVASFVIFALFFRNYYKEYNYVDYSLPTIQMLKKAAYRYKPFQLKPLWILFALLLMDAGLCFNSSLDFSIFHIQITFFGTMSLSVLIGLLVWFLKYKQLRDDALKLIAEMEGE